MLTAEDGLLTFGEAFGDVGCSAFPEVGAVSGVLDLPLSRGFVGVANIDGDIFGIPVVASHSHSPACADDLDGPVVALCAVDEAGLNHGVDGVAVIENERSVI